MGKKEITEAEIIESIADIWTLLTDEERAIMRQNFTIQKYKKNETIYCEGETPTHMLCLLSGKVKIYKDGVKLDRVRMALEVVMFDKLAKSSRER